MRTCLLLIGILGLCHCKETPRTETAPAKASASAVGASASAAAPSASAAPRHSGAHKVFASAPAVVAVAGASASDAGAPGPAKPTATPASVGLPAVDFGPPGPLVLQGYPEPIGSGMDDPATIFGYSKDGAEVIACGHMGAGYSDGPPKGTELGDRCYFSGPTGPTKQIGVEPDKPVSAAFAEKISALKDGAPVHVAKGVGVLPPALVTTWAFAKDITLQVKSDGALRIGGKVSAEEPVYSVTVNVKPPSPDLQYAGRWNGILASPDKSELAFIGHFFCMEWCNEISIVRMPLGRLASLVYNDTGFRHHQKKDFAGSRDLFLKATWADPGAPLPPYNLACAYALSADAVNAEKALKLAIALGGPGVKARAVKDPDFKAVLAAKWFVDVTK